MSDKLSEENRALYARVWAEELAAGRRDYWSAINRLIKAARAEARPAPVVDREAVARVADLGARLGRGELIGGTPYAAECWHAIVKVLALLSPATSPVEEEARPRFSEGEVEQSEEGPVERLEALARVLKRGDALAWFDGRPFKGQALASDLEAVLAELSDWSRRAAAAEYEAFGATQERDAARELLLQAAASDVAARRAMGEEKGSSQSQPSSTRGHSLATREVEPSAARERTIYVVRGTTGEYSDRTEWLTRAFDYEADAVAFCDFLALERQKLPPNESWQDGQDIEAAMRAFDPGFSEDYTGTRWYVEGVTLQSSTAPQSEPQASAGTPATDDQKTPTDDGKGERP
jgi:hypothetical protein